jgi:hypothetical protein
MALPKHLCSIKTALKTAAILIAMSNGRIYPITVYSISVVQRTAGKMVTSLISWESLSGIFIKEAIVFCKELSHMMDGERNWD